MIDLCFYQSLMRIVPLLHIYVKFFVGLVSKATKLATNNNVDKQMEKIGLRND